jgi:putative heme-binding domain-containing protein
MAFTKGTEDLLTSILDPNAAIEPQYTNYHIAVSGGEDVSGIVRSESPTSVTLIRANGETETVLRTRIREMRTDGLSLMPEGLEKGLSAQDLADLIAFLQRRRS